jgi:hypothetical protein
LRVRLEPISVALYRIQPSSHEPQILDKGNGLELKTTVKKFYGASPKVASAQFGRFEVNGFKILLALFCTNICFQGTLTGRERLSTVDLLIEAAVFVKKVINILNEKRADINELVQGG